MPDTAGRLVFAGLGLNDDEGLTLKALREIEAADVVFVETYTSTLERGAVEPSSTPRGPDGQSSSSPATRCPLRPMWTCV